MEPRPPFDAGKMARKTSPPPIAGGLFGAAHAGGGASGGAPGAPGAPGSAGDSAGAPNPPRLSVTQLATMIERALRDHVPTGLKVVGEISQFRERTHWYFDLKDENALVSCVMFASAARKTPFTPQIGQQVLLTGRVDYYAKQGKTTFMVDKMEPVGAGALELKFRQLCDELRALGYFDESRKRTLPLLPRRIAVVTSRTGAALQDVIDTVARRCPSLELALVDVRVQGEGSAPEIAAALRRLGQRHRELAIDVVLLTRGGGSREDLWAFNDRELARAIYESPVPVVAAIGHETDTTIAELVADVRAATPTQAAMRIAPDRAALAQQIDAIESRLGGLVSRRLQLERSRGSELAAELRSAGRELVAQATGRVDRASAALERCRPVAVYAQRESELKRVATLLNAAVQGLVRRADIDEPARRLGAAWSRRLAAAESSIAALDRGLDLVGPSSVMRRGYSLTLKSDGRVVRSTDDVRAGETLTTRLADGSFDSTVNGPEGSPGAGRAPRFAPLPPPRKTRTQRRDPEPGPGLFGSA